MIRALLNLLPLAWRLPAAAIGVAVVLAALGGGYGLWHHHVYSAGYAAAQATYEAKMAAQADANRQAIAGANKALMHSADQLSLKSLELDNALAKINAAADAGPDAHDLGLDAGRVRELDTIR
jgi:hypothetical protein